MSSGTERRRRTGRQEIALAVALWAVVGALPEAGRVVERIVAVVNDEIVLLSELDPVDRVGWQAHEQVRGLEQVQPAVHRRLRQADITAQLGLVEEVPQAQAGGLHQPAEVRQRADCFASRRQPEPSWRTQPSGRCSRERARLRCPTCVLVVTPSGVVARWASEPIRTGPGPSVFVPLVLGPTEIPRVTDPALAQQAPELAVLSVQAHGREPDASELALVALDAAAALEPARAMQYCDLILLALGDAARRQLEALMQPGAYVYRSEFARRYLAEGKAEGKAEALVRVLRARGFELSAEQQERILTCADLALLDTWLARSVAITTLDALFNATP